MKKTIKTLAAGMLVVPALALGVSAVVPAADTQAGTTVNLNSSLNHTQGTGTPDSLDGDDGVIRTVINIMLFIIGVISVIMLIIGGIRYAVSGGDSNAVTSAKNTILYAIIGLIVAIFAYAIINFVLGELVGP